MNVSFFPKLSIFASFVLASMLNVYPLSFGLASYRPMILILVLIFWTMYQPRVVGVSVAFFVGLFSDLILDTRLGHQAFCAVAMVFLLRLASSYTKRLDFMSAWILAGASLVFYRCLLWLFELLTHDNFAWTGFLSVLMSVICFAPLYWLLIKIHHHIQLTYETR